MVILDEVGRLRLFVMDRVVLTDQPQRRLVVKVPPLALHFPMRFRQQRHSFAPPMAALLAPRDTPLRRFQRALRLAISAGGKDARAIRERGERLDAQVDAHFLSSRGQRLYWHISAGEAGIPPIRFSADCDGLGRALKRARPADGNAPDLEQDEEAVV